MADEREYFEVKERVADELLSLPGVHAVGVGGKETGGTPTGELSIRIYVEEKRPLSEIPPEERIPPEIDGLKTDVVERPVPVIVQVPGIDPAVERPDTGRYRPVRGGTQLMREESSGIGTLGCLCRVTGDPTKIVALTNHHVLYASCADAQNGEKVGQPTNKESCLGCCSDSIGKVMDAQCDTDVDIALVQLNGGIEWLAEVEEIGVIRGTHAVTAAEANTKTYQVRKRGRTSGLTGGTVDDLGLHGTALRPDGSVHRTFTGAMSIKPNPDPARPGQTTHFAKFRDSGAAVVNAAGEVVGIIFMQGGDISYAIPIQPVIAKFATGVPATRRVQLEVATATNPGEVQTVPGSAMTALGEAAPAPLAVEDAERLEEELRTSRLGALYADLYDRHARETLALINGNRRVATAWYRSGAPALLQSLVRAVGRPEERIPEVVDGRPLQVCLGDVAAFFERYGSSTLRADLARALPTLPDVAGLTVREAIERLRAADRQLAPT
jgi:hypothetical protein